MRYEEVILLRERYKKYGYGTYESDDGKIYNVDLNKRQILYVRDRFNCKFALDDFVLVKPVGEYGTIIEVNKDEVWGNHQYDVEMFNDGVFNSYYRDEDELEMPT